MEQFLISALCIQPICNIVDYFNNTMDTNQIRNAITTQLRNGNIKELDKLFKQYKNEYFDLTAFYQEAYLHKQYQCCMWLICIQGEEYGYIEYYTYDGDKARLFPDDIYKKVITNF